MRSLRQKLADLPSPGPASRKEPARTTSGSPSHAYDPRAASGGAPASPRASASAGAPTPLVGKPSLDELRARIAALVGHKEPPRPRPDPTATELPFVVEHTASGPRYVRRVRSAPAARVGRAPLVAARDADPATLGLLALDPSLGACDPRRALYLDTETTGLAGGTGTVAFLVGLAFFDEEHNTFVLEQMLLRRLGEEAPILEQVERRMAGASMVVTYNGKAFDVPLLRTRFVMNRRPRPPELPHLDLLHVARRVHRHRLATCTLASIESEVLGRERVGDVSGMDIVEAYSHFLRTGDEGALAGVVTHNEHDVLSMVALLGLYGEPFGALVAADLAGVAKTLHRAGAIERAMELAAEAVRGGGGVVARRVSADISRARGDTAAALRDYEAILEEVDDPAVRLVLAKMYEHRERAYDRALAMLAAGTTEDEAATELRRARLTRKLGRALAQPGRSSRQRGGG